MVLIRGIDARGVVFYTNRESRKGRELAENPLAAMTIHWHAAAAPDPARGRRSSSVADEESDAYFASRAYGSQIGAWASEQSRPIPDHETLERRVVEFGARYPRGGPAPAALGRLPAAPRRRRVLAGPAEPAARAHPVPSRG